jgi:hypothetical protein
VSHLANFFSACVKEPNISLNPKAHTRPSPKILPAPSHYRHFLFQTFVFNVGEHEVIEGLDLVVRSMHKNELSIVSIKPELAYGSQGRSRTMLGKLEEIPGNERITYLLGLLHFEKSRENSTLTWAQRRKCGQSKMRLANW